MAEEYISWYVLSMSLNMAFGSYTTALPTSTEPGSMTDLFRNGGDVRRREESTWRSLLESSFLGRSSLENIYLPNLGNLPLRVLTCPDLENLYVEDIPFATA
jgi:hypothetical protein